MNDFGNMATSSRSRENVYRHSDVKKEGEPIKYANKTPSKIKSEDLKTIEQFYFNFNKDHPDRTESWTR